MSGFPSFLPGVWRTQGYNKIFELDEQGFTIYDLCAVSCVPAASGTPEEFMRVFDRLENPAPGQISLYARGGITRYTLERLNDGAPAELLCAGRERAADPRFNFEVFWRYFQENYAFFELRGMDWEAVYRTWLPRIDDHTTPEELLEIFRHILVQLDDSHATLQAGEKEISTKRPHALVRHWQQEFDSTEFLGLYARGIPRLHAEIQARVLDGKGRSALQGQLLWGRLRPDVGYMALFSLMDIYGGFDQLHFAGFEVVNPVYLQALEGALDEVQADLGGMKTILLDVRFNLGGHDGAGLAVARRFAGRATPAFTKQARWGGGFTAPQTVVVPPAAGEPFSSRVGLLTSAATASAAEVLVHGMMALPQVLRIGGATRGVLSDMLLMRLPNGWQVSLSNEMYRAADGNCYEGRGVPPQVEAVTFVEPGFYESLDQTILQALDAPGLRSEP